MQEKNIEIKIAFSLIGLIKPSRSSGCE